jgi:uncharacterized protein
MRVARKEIRESAVLERLLGSCPVGRLGTIGRDGFPMIKPLKFVYLAGRIYFHSARAGEKMDDIARDNRVCFEVDMPLGFARAMDNPCRAGYRYQSVIVQGRARIVDDQDERLTALRGLMEKYQPEGGYGGFGEDALAVTSVVAIEAVHMTGKHDLGDDRGAS